MKLNNNKQCGQVLLEWVVVFPIVFFLFLIILDISRLLSYQSQMQASLFRVSYNLTLQDLELARVYHNKKNIKKIEEKIEQYLARELSLFPILALPKPILSLQTNWVFNEDNNYPSGVYFKLYSCLPVLFSEFYSFFYNKDSSIIGKNVNGNRDCLGRIHHVKIAGVRWFRVRAAAYAPWPASSQIYRNGVYLPTEIDGLSSNHKNRVSEYINDSNLTDYFFKKEFTYDK